MHNLTATDAGVADCQQLPQLLHGGEKELYGDRAYWNETDRNALESQGVRYRVNRRAHWRKPVPDRWRVINKSRSRVRARGEHAFLVVKRQWGFDRTRYRGLTKNLARAYSALGLANLYRLRSRLRPSGAKCAL